MCISFRFPSFFISLKSYHLQLNERIGCSYFYFVLDGTVHINGVPTWNNDNKTITQGYCINNAIHVLPCRTWYMPSSYYYLIAVNILRSGEILAIWKLLKQTTFKTNRHSTTWALQSLRIHSTFTLGSGTRLSCNIAYMKRAEHYHDKFIYAW